MTGSEVLSIRHGGTETGAVSGVETALPQKDKAR
jgi:hypothetical protein